MAQWCGCHRCVPGGAVEECGAEVFFELLMRLVRVLGWMPIVSAAAASVECLLVVAKSWSLSSPPINSHRKRATFESTWRPAGS